MVPGSRRSAFARGLGCAWPRRGRAREGLLGERTRQHVGAASMAWKGGSPSRPPALRPDQRRETDDRAGLQATNSPGVQPARENAAQSMPGACRAKSARAHGVGVAIIGEAPGGRSGPARLQRMTAAARRSAGEPARAQALDVLHVSGSERRRARLGAGVGLAIRSPSHLQQEGEEVFSRRCPARGQAQQGADW